MEDLCFINRKEEVVEAARRGSVVELEVLAAHWQSLPDPLGDGLHCVFFHHLSSSRPPTNLVSQSDSDGSDEGETGTAMSTESLRAFWSIYALAQMAVKITRVHGDRYGPEFIEAWPRIFEWSAFFISSGVQPPSTFNNHIHGIRSVRDMISRAWCTIGRSSLARDLMEDTPGVKEVAAKLWLFESDEDELDVSGAHTFAVGFLLVGIMYSESEDGCTLFTDLLMEVSGGNIATIARTTLACFRHAFLGPHYLQIEERTYCSILLNFMLRICEPSDPVAREAFFGAFIEYGGVVICVEFLIRLASVMNGRDPNYARLDLVVLRHLIQAFVFLANYLQTQRGSGLILQAVKAGLITAFVECSPLYCDILDEDYLVVSNSIAKILPRYLTYSKVLKAVDKALQNLEKTKQFLSLRSTRAWDDFRNLARWTGERLAVLKDAKERMKTSSVCSNETCMKMDIRTNFGKCGGCGKSIYCSRECQIRHWKTRHRLECKGADASPLSSFDICFTQALNFRMVYKTIGYLKGHIKELYPGVPLDDIFIIVNHDVVPFTISSCTRDDALEFGIMQDWPTGTTLIVGVVAYGRGERGFTFTPVPGGIWNLEKTVRDRNARLGVTAAGGTTGWGGYSAISDRMDQEAEARREIYCGL